MAMVGTAQNLDGVEISIAGDTQSIPETEKESNWALAIYSTHKELEGITQFSQESSDLIAIAWEKRL